jgi:hypothetical protein
VGGDFKNAAGIPTADYIARWNGSSWSALGSNGSGNGALKAAVDALAFSGSDLYVGGLFFDAARIPRADYVARWTGSSWAALGSDGAGDGAIVGAIYALAVSNSGDVYVGGFFLDAAGIPTADYIAKWNGNAWSALGSNGSGNGALNQDVDALAVSGDDLYVGGYFFDAAGIATADAIARWNGSAWSALGSDGAGDGALGGSSASVGALAVSGSDLYVGGEFFDATGIPTADYVARWNGSSWSALGSNGGGNGAINGSVHALAVSGNDLYVGGTFTNAAGITRADAIARWNGSTWSALGSDGAGDGALSQTPFPFVVALAVSGGQLYVGGPFTNAAGIATADYVAKWALRNARKPDGRIRLGTGSYVGNNIYNITGTNQTRTASAAPSASITFGISIQNDGTSADRFTVQATGTAVSGYAVKYFRRTTDITAAVVAGTYQTSSLAPLGTYLIMAKVTVKSTASVGSKVARLLIVTSVGNSAKKDAVKLIGKRA